MTAGAPFRLVWLFESFGVSAAGKGAPTEHSKARHRLTFIPAQYYLL